MKRVSQDWKDEWLKSIPIEELVQRLSPQDRLKGLTSQDRLEGLTPDVLLEELSAGEIAEYLRKNTSRKKARQLLKLLKSLDADAK